MRFCSFVQFEKYIQIYSPGDCHAKNVREGVQMKCCTGLSLHVASISLNVFSGIHFVVALLTIGLVKPCHGVQKYKQRGGNTVVIV